MRYTARAGFFIGTLIILFLQIPEFVFCQSSIIETEPSGATVLNENEEEIGKTPFDLSVSLKKGTRIYIVKENYDTVTLAFSFNVKPLLFPENLDICVPCRIVPITTNSSKEKSRALLKLSKTIKEIDDKADVIRANISPFEYKIPDTAYIGKVDGNRVKWGDKKNKELFDSPGALYSSTISGFDGSYIGLISFNSRYKDYADFKIKAVFSVLQFNVHRSNVHYKGFASAKSDWEIYSKYDSIVPLLKFSIVSEVFNITMRYSLLSILRQIEFDTERKILETDTLYDFLKEKQKLNLELSKGNIVELKRPPHGSFANLKEINRYSSPNVVTVEGESGFGSGFFIDGTGYIVTNFHVIDDEKKINIIVYKSTKLEAQIIKTNRDYDLALLKINFDSLPGLWLADSDSIEVGESVVAIGTPLDKMLSSTLTKGIISGYREIAGIEFIQTDVSMNSGNSGGPLINEKGEVIGMTTMKISKKGIEGLGFCIPSNDIIRMLNISYK